MTTKLEETKMDGTKRQGISAIQSWSSYFADCLQKIPNTLIPVDNTLSVTLVSPEYLQQHSNYNNQFSEKCLCIQGPSEKDMYQINKGMFGTESYNSYKTSICEENSYPDKIKGTREDYNFCKEMDYTTLQHKTKADNSAGQSPSALMNVWQKLVNIVNSRESQEEEEQQERCSTPIVPRKRVHSPKARRKLNVVSRGRGRGRGKSQLRRSGVSQTRHRKERTKHDITIDMQNDFDDWKNVEFLNDCKSTSAEMTVGNDFTDEDVTDFAVNLTITDNSNYQLEPERVNFTAKVKYRPACSFTFGFSEVNQDGDSRDDPARSRQSSVTSVESEDSFCIIFESDSECEEIEEEDESETDESDDEVISHLTPTKVFFFNNIFYLEIIFNFSFSLLLIYKCATFNELQRKNKSKINSERRYKKL